MMKITLKQAKMTNQNRYFDLPSIVHYSSVDYKMTSPANLVRALNRDKKTLLDLFAFNTCQPEVGNVLMHRKQLIVRLTQKERDEISLKQKQVNDEKQRLRQLRNCVVCGVKTIRSREMIGTCSQTCRKQKILERNESVKRNHWCGGERRNEILTHRVQTRRMNDQRFERKYLAWNKGKHGIYSPDTILKISNAALKQFENGIFKKTKIEEIYEQILQELHVNYTYSFILCRRQFDFLLKDYNILVELQGDFWHGNPTIWGITKPLREHQRMKRLDDMVKKSLAECNGYRYVEFWEKEIHDNLSNVVLKTKELLQ